jgi:hypothetical protein
MIRIIVSLFGISRWGHIYIYFFFREQTGNWQTKDYVVLWLSQLGSSETERLRRREGPAQTSGTGAESIKIHSKCIENR